jgi:hypothetical protein
MPLDSLKYEGEGMASTMLCHTMSKWNMGIIAIILIFILGLIPKLGCLLACKGGCNNENALKTPMSFYSK